MIILLLVLIAVVIAIIIVSFCLFRHSHRIQCKAIFNNKHCRYHFPIPNGYRNATSFHLYNGTDVRLGVWHFPPQNNNNPKCTEDAKLESKSENSFNDEKLVILFAHGTGSDRRDARDLYRMATSTLGVHVVTFDYRGFGDSANVRPTSSEIISDTKVVYDWILEQGVTPNRILLWGASLGTAVMVRLLSQLDDTEYPLGTVLEAPFTSLTELLPEHFPIKRKALLRAFHYLVVSPIGRNPALDFNSLALLSQIRCPLLVVHAEDDSVVPYWLGRKLYETALTVQPKVSGAKTKFHGFSADKKWDHFFMQKDPDLYRVVREFIDSITDE